MATGSVMPETTFTVGEKFSSVEEFEKKLEEYKKQAFVEFWRRDSRTITAARKRGIDRPLKAELVYHDLKYCCVHGGRSFKPRGKGSRCTSTFKQDCSAHISLKIDKDGTAFEVVGLCTEHNHEISQELFKHLPRQRSLSTEAKEKASKLLQMNVNKKLLQQELVQETGNVILLKDLTNIATAAKHGKSRNDIDVTVDTLMTRYGASVEVYCDKEKNLKGIFFQDQQMKDAFKAYPELLCLDATYKLLELGLPVYLMLCEDSNGQSEVVAVCLLVTEDGDSMTWMMDAFKKHNVNWESIRVVMADKDIGERDVIKQQLPNAAVLICLFHTLRSLRREITCDKMGISAGQRTLCLEMVQKMAYATSVSQYNDLHTQFRTCAPKEVVSYFDKNWHDIRDEWVLGMKSNCGNFLNFTNNRLESINGKLKQVVNRHSSLEEFIERFFVILTALRTERDHKAALVFQKVKVNPFRDDSPQSMYSRLLTTYAAGFVHKQLELADKVSCFTAVEDKYMVKTSEGDKYVTSSTCECIFRRSMLLPCRHIFALRSQLSLCIYDPDLCHERWTTAYYRSTQRVFLTHSSESTMVLTTSKKHRRSLSQHQKFRMASIITAELASVASYASKAQFDRRIKLLKELLSYWKNGEEVGLAELDESDVSEDVSDDLKSDDDEDDGGDPSSTLLDASGLKQIAATKVPKVIDEVDCLTSKSPHAGNNTVTFTHDKNPMQSTSEGSSDDQKSDGVSSSTASGVKTIENAETVITKEVSKADRFQSSMAGSAMKDAVTCADNNMIQSDRNSSLVNTSEVTGIKKSCNSDNSVSVDSGPNREDKRCPVHASEQESQMAGRPNGDGGSVQGTLGIKVAPIVKRRGRPRGHEMTTIGLPAKRAKKDVDKKPCSFSCLHTSRKQEVMLLWFVDKKVAEMALKQAVLIEEEHVECRPERITDAVVDENVDVHLIRKYFTYDAWLLVEQVLKRKQKKMTWICNVCHRDLHAKTSGPSIACESCLLWFHFACIGLSKQPKTKNWFCRSCYAASKSDLKI